jgi:hypothetical protein
MASTMSKQTSAKSMLTCQTVKSRNELIFVMPAITQRACLAETLGIWRLGNRSMQKLLCEGLPMIEEIATRPARQV